MLEERRRGREHTRLTRSSCERPLLPGVEKRVPHPRRRLLDQRHVESPDFGCRHEVWHVPKHRAKVGAFPTRDGSLEGTALRRYVADVVQEFPLFPRTQDVDRSSPTCELCRRRLRPGGRIFPPPAPAERRGGCVTGDERRLSEVVRARASAPARGDRGIRGVGSRCTRATRGVGS